MHVNELADATLTYLQTKHTRVYRNNEPTTVTKPYVVFFVDSGLPTKPGVDFYVNVRIFDEPRVSVRAIETLADAIVGDGQRVGSNPSGLDNQVLATDNTLVHYQLEQRQFVGAMDLTESQMIDLRFVARVYDRRGLN